MAVIVAIVSRSLSAELMMGLMLTTVVVTMPDGVMMVTLAVMVSDAADVDALPPSVLPPPSLPDCARVRTREEGHAYRINGRRTRGGRGIPSSIAKTALKLR